MFHSQHAQHAQSGVPVQSSLGPETAPFRQWKRSDLSAAWQALPASAWLAIELPDMPWGRAYYWWAVEQNGTAPPTGDDIGVMLVNMQDYRHPDDPRAEAMRCLRALLHDGRPPVEHVVRTFGSEELGPGYSEPRRAD